MSGYVDFIPQHTDLKSGAQSWSSRTVWQMILAGDMNRNTNLDQVMWCDRCDFCSMTDTRDLHAQTGCKHVKFANLRSRCVAPFHVLYDSYCSKKISGCLCLTCFVLVILLRLLGASLQVLSGGLGRLLVVMRESQFRMA